MFSKDGYTQYITFFLVIFIAVNYIISFRAICQLTLTSWLWGVLVKQLKESACWQMLKMKVTQNSFGPRTESDG